MNCLKCGSQAKAIEKYGKNTFCDKICQKSYYIGLRGDDDIIGIITSDKIEIKVRKDQIKGIQTLLDLVQDANLDEPIVLSNISSRTFKYILRKDETDFKKMSTDDFFEVLFAVNYLNYEEMIDEMLEDAGLRLFRVSNFKYYFLNLKPLILKIFYSFNSFNDALIFKKKVDIFDRKILLNLTDVDEEYYNEKIIWNIISALKYNHLDIVKKMLKKNKYNNDIVFANAAKYGRVEIMQLIIKDSNPAYKYNLPFILAAENNQVEVVKYLLTFKEVDPTGGRLNVVITDAVTKGYVEIVKILLNTPNRGIEPKIPDLLYSVVSIYAVNRYEMTKLLLSDKRVDPARNEVLVRAAQQGYLDVVELLYRDGRSNQFLEDAYIAASLTGHFKIVEYLINVVGMNPSLRHSHALREAVDRGNLEFIEFLLKKKVVVPVDDLIRISIRERDVLRLFNKYGYDL